MERTKIAAAIFVVAALVCGYFIAEAIFFPPGDITVPRSTVINESAVAAKIEFISLEAVNGDPWYRSLMAEQNPVIATNESYFIGQLPAGSVIALQIDESQSHFTDVSFVFWGLNKNLTKPLKWEEIYQAPENYVIGRIAKNETTFIYNTEDIAFVLFLGMLFFIVLAISAWRWSSHYTRR